jgi:NAD(P)-dependent dehydrogenase (short-subunit alcohol dehydrogenase family)
VTIRTFRDAVIIITGGASGLGRALGEELASRGAEVVLADLQTELAEQVAEGIRSRGGRASAVHLDVTDFTAVTRVIEETAHQRGRLDYVFNNAGIVVAGELELHRIEDWNRIIDVNLRGVVNGVQSAYPIMKRQGFGHIVNTASIAGLLAAGGLSSYGATKHAIVGLSTALRVEAASHGVRVSVLCPGPVNTPIAEGGKFGKILQPLPPDVQRELWERESPITTTQFATGAVRGVARNQAIIVLPWRWKIVWMIYRWFPSLGLALSRQAYLSRRKFLDERVPT